MVASTPYEGDLSTKGYHIYMYLSEWGIRPATTLWKYVVHLTVRRSTQVLIFLNHLQNTHSSSLQCILLYRTSIKLLFMLEIVWFFHMFPRLFYCLYKKILWISLVTSARPPKQYVLAVDTTCCLTCEVDTILAAFCIDDPYYYYLKKFTVSIKSVPSFWRDFTF